MTYPLIAWDDAFGTLSALQHDAAPLKHFPKEMTLDFWRLPLR